MKVLLAESAGFCWGVKRVVSRTLEEARKAGRRLFTYGPLIHNQDMTKRLEDAGVHMLSPDADEATLAALPENAALVIRAHGITPAETERLCACGIEVIDGTCPHVVQIQRSVEQASHDGRTVVIIGDKGHAEVIGLLGFCRGHGYVVSTLNEIKNLEIAGPITVVAQSTLDERHFISLSTALSERFTDLAIKDTRCDATARTQAEALSLCDQADAVMVIGGLHSANTRRLAEICCAQGVPTYHIERAADLESIDFSQVEVVGVTAGSSTPDWIIEDVVRALRKK
jgi:(E)-4-hydroxy-3-methyl-but-2-enyl pyrophosphate reductase